MSVYFFFYYDIDLCSPTYFSHSYSSFVVNEGSLTLEIIFRSYSMKFPYQNFTNSNEIINEIGTKFVKIRIHVQNNWNPLKNSMLPVYPM